MKSIANAEKWLQLLKAQALPAGVHAQLDALRVGEACDCGCNSFVVSVSPTPGIPPLLERGLVCELAFKSNKTEEINVLIFSDPAGYLDRIDVTLGGYGGLMPDGIEVTGLIGIWPAG
ncbi:hypothetical protein IGB42_02917 [Andreprevotia sp. IGB-42]|uniref:hypothetical protein n=1 Tax=Andreprevotia sp. IGB-42 TaxID=2497473 RepID=UPI00135C83D7|nr:hypothetical protein [Andreprevotia sp. IGB-42]KAF0812625.1 hypothetical protein IGB42_02917 [Andreprevotia sp. IGB-42]